MLQVKDTRFFSELENYFANGHNTFFTIMSIVKDFKFKVSTPAQSSYSGELKLHCLVLLYLLDLKNIRDFFQNYSTWIECSKDVFYRFKNNSHVDWRKILNKVNRKLIVSPDNTSITCFIADDTDFPKRGKTMEYIGKIFSHINHSYILGYKSLHLNYWNGKTLFGLDHSMHIELGKNQNQGMKEEDLTNRYTKDRKENSPGKKREDELTQNKISVLISMIKRQVKAGMKPKYLLADSWFTCYKLIKSSISLNIHYIGMTKIGLTKYVVNGKEQNASEIIQRNKHNKIKNRKLKLSCFTVGNLFLKDIPIKAFFFQSGRGNKYHMIITTDLSLDIVKAYEIYKIRWSIEIFFKDSKQNLSLGKSQSTCIDSHIADTTLSIIAYNILSVVKDKTEYSTIGGLFNEISNNKISPTIIQRINELLQLILDTLQEVLDVDVIHIMEEKVSRRYFEDKYLKVFIKLAA